MSEFDDFNDKTHRIISGTATFQRGVYQLFVLKNRNTVDDFALVLRMYQCLFLLCITQLLLDFNFVLNPKKFPRRKLYKIISRQTVDPAALVTHSVFEKGTWTGFDDTSHMLYDVSKKSLDFFKRVVLARHNLIYRPFMLDKVGSGEFHWQDCDLMDLLEDIPTVENIEELYINFYQALMRQRDIENRTGKTEYASSFLEDLYAVYEDQRDNRPTETLLISYARILNPDDASTIESVRNYRNELFEVDWPF